MTAINADWWFAFDDHIAMDEPPVNQNRAGTGYSTWVILGILGSLSDDDYTCTSAKTPGAMTVGHRRNDLKKRHARALRRAAQTLHGAGVRASLRWCNGRPDRVVVYGPKQGGGDGRYSL